MQRSFPPTIISSVQTSFVLDNSVISNLHRAVSLGRVLEFWSGRWLVPFQVREEAASWPTEGSRVISTLEDLRERRVLDFVVLDPRSEGSTFARLSRTLGQGESATIAIAYHRHYGVALDDYPAQRTCHRLIPPVPWIVTEGLLQCAVTEGHLTTDEARVIWMAMGIEDPKRQVL